MASNSKLLFWEREAERWEKSAKAGYNLVLREIYEERPSADEFLRKLEKLHRAFVALQGFVDFSLQIAPTLFERQDGRARWDRYLTALHYFQPRFQRGFVLKSIFSLLKLGGVAELIRSYSVEFDRVIWSLHATFSAADSFIENWRRGEEIIRMYRKEPQKDLVGLYASYRTWPEDFRLEDFHKQLQGLVHYGINIIIEDSVKLFLMISDGFLEIIVRLPLIERLEEFGEEDRSRELIEGDLRELIRRTTKYIRDSEYRKFSNLLIRKTVEHAIDSWYEEERRLRSQHPPELRRRFVDQFEEGLIL